MQRNTRPNLPRVRFKERRRWQRLPLALPVFVRGLERQGHEMLEFATILNVGSGGVLFASRKHVQKRSELSREIPSAVPAMERAGPLQNKFVARVLRMTQLDHLYLYAARFKSPLRVMRSKTCRFGPSSPSAYSDLSGSGSRSSSQKNDLAAPWSPASRNPFTQELHGFSPAALLGILLRKLALSRHL